LNQICDSEFRIWEDYLLITYTVGSRSSLISCDVYRKGGKRGGEEEEEEEEEAAAGSWRNQAASNTIMIRGLPSGVTEEQVLYIPVPYLLTSLLVTCSTQSAM
jgi:hypothetical protein